MNHIKNYTSTVASVISAAAIESLLVQVGATSVSRWYEDQQLKGFIFQMPLNGVPLVFRLPANVDKVAKLMLKEGQRPDVARLISVRAQAARTAWRTLHEWVQIQVTLIQLEQVDPLQIFLPYNYDQDSGHTFYDNVKNGTVKLLAA